MNADVEILVEERRDVLAVPTAAMRTAEDIATTAMLVGIDEIDLREELENAAQDTPSGSSTENQFWVLVANAGRIEPAFIDAGVTDLDYSEILSGLDAGAEVLLLPSTGMVKTQQRTRDQMSGISRIAGISRRSD